MHADCCIRDISLAARMTRGVNTAVTAVSAADASSSVSSHQLAASGKKTCQSAAIVTLVRLLKASSRFVNRLAPHLKHTALYIWQYMCISAKNNRKWLLL